ncbi:hypothetical protein LNP74_28675 [Klebsiella pneumoniae subsp. pneumoniae]|nr:hypothetical protein [Klebsiella pneumoniae subsp. pneumoniae]
MDNILAIPGPAVVIGGGVLGGGRAAAALRVVTERSLSSASRQRELHWRR